MGRRSWAWPRSVWTRSCDQRGVSHRRPSGRQGERRPLGALLSFFVRAALVLEVFAVEFMFVFMVAVHDVVHNIEVSTSILWSEGP